MRAAGIPDTGIKMSADLQDYAAGHNIDIGFGRADDAPGGLSSVVSVALPLLNGVVDGINEAGGPTFVYFSHYKTVNAAIDRYLLEIGLMLEAGGFRCIPVAASQSDPSSDGFSGLYSHKKAACIAGLGGIGLNNLFLHRRYGSRVRLGTLFTDCPLPAAQPLSSPCAGCMSCVRVCPAQALLGEKPYFDPRACSGYMKREYRSVGHGDVCGLCMAVCPACRPVK